MGNNANYVQAGKPKNNGAIFRAPFGTALPTSTSDALSDAFKCLGLVSDSGVDNDNSPESDTKKAWGGSTIMVTQTEKKDTWKYTLLESLNVDLLKVIYGNDNVKGTLETGVTVDATSDEQESGVWVIDTVLGDCNKRIVIPNGKISEMGTVTYKDDDPVGYELTVEGILTSVTYSDGGTSVTKEVTHREFIKKKTTS